MEERVSDPQSISVISETFLLKVNLIWFISFVGATPLIFAEVPVIGLPRDSIIFWVNE